MHARRETRACSSRANSQVSLIVSLIRGREGERGEGDDSRGRRRRLSAPGADCDGGDGRDVPGDVEDEGKGVRNEPADRGQLLCLVERLPDDSARDRKSPRPSHPCMVVIEGGGAAGQQRRRDTITEGRGAREIKGGGTAEAHNAKILDRWLKKRLIRKHRATILLPAPPQGATLL